MPLNCLNLYPWTVNTRMGSSAGCHIRTVDALATLHCGYWAVRSRSHNYRGAYIVARTVQNTSRNIHTNGRTCYAHLSDQYTTPTGRHIHGSNWYQYHPHRTPYTPQQLIPIPPPQDAIYTAATDTNTTPTGRHIHRRNWYTLYWAEISLNCCCDLIITMTVFWIMVIELNFELHC